jgi:transposase
LPGHPGPAGSGIEEYLMFYSASGVKVYLVLGRTDMRKSVNGLSILVSEHIGLDPLSGHLFVFCNGRRNILKVLYWDRNGFCLWYKRLEKEVFRWPETQQEVLEIGSRELGWLLDGLEISQHHAYASEKYDHIY